MHIAYATTFMVKKLFKSSPFSCQHAKKVFYAIFFEKIPKNTLSNCRLRVASDFSGALKMEFNKINCQLQFITMKDIGSSYETTFVVFKKSFLKACRFIFINNC